MAFQALVSQTPGPRPSPLTSIPDIPPAGDGASRPAGEERVGSGKADWLDPVRPGHLGLQLHQGYVVPLLRVRVLGRDYHTADAVARLKGIPPVQLVPTSVDDVR